MLTFTEQLVQDGYLSPFPFYVDTTAFAFYLPQSRSPKSGVIGLQFDFSGFDVSKLRLVDLVARVQDNDVPPRAINPVPLPWEWRLFVDLVDDQQPYQTSPPPHPVPNTQTGVSGEPVIAASTTVEISRYTFSTTPSVDDEAVFRLGSRFDGSAYQKDPQMTAAVESLHLHMKSSAWQGILPIVMWQASHDAAVNATHLPLWYSKGASEVDPRAPHLRGRGVPVDAKKKPRRG